MESIALFALSLTVYLASAFNVRGLGNYTLQQNVSMPVAQQNEAEFFSRITNGEPALPNQFKYQVGFRTMYANGGIKRCGGSLISNRWVLTAAHCLFGGISVDVYLGSTKFDAPKVAFRRLPRSEMIGHEEYNGTTFIHDIGLIRIPRVKFLGGIEDVLLPPRDLPEHVDSYAYLAGWGRTSDSSKDFSPILLYFLFKIISNDDCSKFFGSRKIYEGKICTETSHQIAGCAGDSGSPLVLEDQNIQIGIYSFGYGLACEEGHPDAHTRVKHYLDWIRLRTGLEV